MRPVLRLKGVAMPTPENIVYIELADRDGYIGRTDVYFKVPNASTVGDMLAAMELLLNLVQDCSGGRIVKAQLRMGMDVTSFSLKPIEANATASYCLNLAFAHNASDSLPWNFLVPAVSLSVLSGGQPDMSEGGTIDLLADVLENQAPLLSGMTFITNRGGALGPTADGFCSARQRSRLFARQSMEVGD